MGHEDVNVVAAVADVIIYEQILCVLLDELRDGIDDAGAGADVPGDRADVGLDRTDGDFIRTSFMSLEL
jgi:hypothetical protein